jgi:hypothetical protein
VVEVTSLKATIQFSDGVIRKIASSHYMIPEPGDPAAFVPIPDIIPVVKKARVTSKRSTKFEQPAG